MVTARTLFREPPIRWLTPTPMWPGLADSTERTVGLREPAILRFAGDNFMDDFLTIIAGAPERLHEWQAQYETWREPMPTPPLPPLPSTSSADVANGFADKTLKLYQPTHQRFYLVTANLVCRIPGLPDKMLNLSRGEQASFVLRRKMQVSDGAPPQEHALVQGVWQPLPPGQEAQLISGEQQYPMFPATYTEFPGHRRRILAGLIPVSGREALINAGRQPDSEAGTLLAPGTEDEDRVGQLVTVLDVDVFSPWRALNRQVSERVNEHGTTIYGTAKQVIVTSRAEITENAERTALKKTVEAQRDQFQLASWYILFDLANYLETHLNPVWQVITEAADKSSLTLAQRNLFDALEDVDTASFKPGSDFDIPAEATQANYFALIEGEDSTFGATTLVEALRAVADESKSDFLETTTLSYDTTAPDFPQPGADWPDTKFLLCGQNVRDLVNNLDDSETSAGLIRLALEETQPNPGQRIPLVPLAKQLTETIEEDDYANDTFVIRCIFERPNCPPTARPTVVSDPTQPFRLASYFDPDAPARPIRIPMPVDTTPAGLRKFAKNTMFVLSDTLACQVEKARSLTFGDLVLSVLPWPFHKDLDTSGGDCEGGTLDFGMICTLSIPIITICALILLIIIVLLLDIIFKWVPYLIFCLPLPGLKAKGNSE